MSEEKNGSKTWMITVRILFVTLSILQGIIMTWAYKMSDKIWNHETKIAVHDNILISIDKNLVEIKETLKGMK